MSHTTSRFPLPDGWSEPERVEDVVDADGLHLHRVGLSSTRDGLDALGSAADAHGSPDARARFELMERVCILDASREQSASFKVRVRGGDIARDYASSRAFPVSNEPSKWAYARSNGVALHTDWESACENAELELAERDRVLRAWLGETKPQRLPFDVRSTPLSKTRSYEWSAYAFPASPSGSFALGVESVGVFGFPVKPTAPFVFGYGARRSTQGALEAATREAMQLLAFLWGESTCARAPAPAPTPMCHLETYQCPDRQALLRSWLEGSHCRYWQSPPRGPSGDVRFVDLTPSWMAGRFRVAKAVADSALPLAFGLAPLTAHLPVELQIHPIP